MYRIRVTGRASYKTLGPTWRKLSLSPRPSVQRTSQNRDWCSVHRACVNRATIKTYYTCARLHKDVVNKGTSSELICCAVRWPASAHVAIIRPPRFPTHLIRDQSFHTTNVLPSQTVGRLTRMFFFTGRTVYWVASQGTAQHRPSQHRPRSEQSNHTPRFKATAQSSPRGVSASKLLPTVLAEVPRHPALLDSQARLCLHGHRLTVFAPFI